MIKPCGKIYAPQPEGAKEILMKYTSEKELTLDEAYNLLRTFFKPKYTIGEVDGPLVNHDGPFPSFTYVFVVYD